MFVGEINSYRQDFVIFGVSMDRSEEIVRGSQTDVWNFKLAWCWIESKATENSLSMCDV